MSEPKEHGVRQIITEIVLTAAVAFQAWTAQTFYQMHADTASLKVKVESNDVRISTIEQRGSPVIQGITVRLDSLQASQTRIENHFEQFMRDKTK